MKVYIDIQADGTPKLRPEYITGSAFPKNKEKKAMYYCKKHADTMSKLWIRYYRLKQPISKIIDNDND